MGLRFVDQYAVVEGLAPRTPSSSTPDYVCLKNVAWMTAIIHVDNATTVTGSAITLKQATAVAGTSEKALGFAKAYRNIDTAASDALAEFTVTSDTFTTDATDNKNLLYVIEIDPTTLDTNNGFDCVRVGTGNATAAVLNVVYVLKMKAQDGPVAPSAIVD